MKSRVQGIESKCQDKEVRNPEIYTRDSMLTECGIQVTRARVEKLRVRR